MQQEIWFQKYKILGLLGRGGTARVYLAEHIKLHSYRAIKFISKNNPLYNLQRNEAFILKNLKHSCIPIIYDIEEDEEGSYIVEQYLEGDTLKDFVEAKGPLREEVIIHLGIQICDLIHYLHSSERPIFYLDLKPENIILSGDTLKLIDFGSAIYQDQLPDHQGYSGTIGYAAPELYRLNKIDGRCDVYGIGMLLYFMASGISFLNNAAGFEHIDLAGNCSRKLKDIIIRCLKINPVQRYASPEKLSKQLSALIHKNQLKSSTASGIRIAVAGAQARLGVTHLCFRLCSYLAGQEKICLYEEVNGSGCVHAIKSCYEDVENKEGIYELEGIPMRSRKHLGQAEDSSYPYLIQDYGELSEENLDEFLSADVRLLILGAKDWELEKSEKALNMVTEYKDIGYLFNFLNGRQFIRIQKSMKHRNTYRIPYEPDPFADSTAKNDAPLFEELLLPLEQRAFQGRTGAFPEREVYHEA